MTTAALYARKSNEQEGRTQKETSVAEQERACRALIEKNGWSIEPAHVYVDDGVSGALFGEDRPAFYRLSEDIRRGAKAKRLPFDVLVCYDGDRLGRDRIRTDHAVVEILDAGVRLFFANGEERVINNATDGFMLTAKNYAAEMERERAAARTRDAMHSKAKRGESTGTPPFGYRIVAVGSHKELVPNPAEADVVRQIFTLSADGYGLARIAHALNREHPGMRKWSGPSVRHILHNSIYIGRVVYGKHRLVVKGGKKARRVAVPESEWVRVAKPELQLVPEPLWRQVEQRNAAVFSTYLRSAAGRLSGRPDQTVSAHLLTGFMVCGLCGSRLVVWSATGKKAQRANPAKPIHRYAFCWKHKSGGNAACANAKGVPLADLTAVIVHQIKGDVLTQERIDQVAKDLAADADSAPERVAARRSALEAEHQRLEQRIAALVDAIEDGGADPDVRARLAQRRGELQETEARMAQLDSTQALVHEWSTSGQQKKIQSLLNDWQAALTDNPVVGRQVLRKILVGPIVVWPEADGSVRYEARGSYARLLTGVIGGAEPSAVLIKRGIGVPRPDDLASELKALAAAQPVNKPGGSPTAA